MGGGIVTHTFVNFAGNSPRQDVFYSIMLRNSESLRESLKLHQNFEVLFEVKPPAQMTKVMFKGRGC